MQQHLVDVPAKSHLAGNHDDRYAIAEFTCKLLGLADIDRFQLEVLAAANCEELALQPGLSDELARSWMLCSLYSLYDAISLSEVALEGSTTPTTS